MDTQTYLLSLLQSSAQYVLTDLDKTIIANKGLRTYILTKLFSKQYRKWKVDPHCRLLVEEAVDQALSNNTPVKIFFAQGSYKLWRVASAPEPNWAEFFNIAYLLSYLAPIAAAYKPGLSLTYYFLTILPEVHNNITTSEVTTYAQSFAALLHEFSPYLPKNMQVVLEKDVDTYEREDYIRLLDIAKLSADKQFYTWPVTKQEDYFRRARLNIKWSGKQDLTSLTEVEQQRFMDRAVLYEYAATQDILMKDKQSRGVILSTFSREDSIGIGSTSTSVVKHWVGVGVLERGQTGYHTRILSPVQYEEAHHIESDIVSVQVISGRQYKTIEVYPHHFDFSR